MKKLLVSPILFYIKFWAKIALSIHKPTTVGIAGSVGKSSARNAMFAILADRAKTRKVSGNSETGVPLGILGIDITDYSLFEWARILVIAPFKIFSTIGYKYLVVEMGIDDPSPPKNMDYLLSIIRPDVSIDLNATATHTQQFEKLLNKKPEGISNIEFLIQKIAEEDLKIITQAKPLLGIYNGDDLHISKIMGNYHGRAHSFGDNSPNISYKKYVVNQAGTTFEFTIDGKNIEIKITNQALPIVYREVFAAVLLCAKELKIDLHQASDSLNNKFSLPKGRSTIFTGKNKTLIIDSSYNSSAESVLTFLDLLSELCQKEERTPVLIMGDMRELGHEAEIEHKRVAKKINQTVKLLYCVGPLTQKFILPNIDPEIESHWYETSKRAAEKLLENLPDKSIILVKGSQNKIYLEEAVKLLLADPKDIKRLCRQSSYWMRVKSEYFNN